MSSSASGSSAAAHAATQGGPRRKWAFDLASEGGGRSGLVKTTGSGNTAIITETAGGGSRATTIAEPIGFLKNVVDEETRAPGRQLAEQMELKRKRLWDVATAPGKSIFMTAFMLWMSGAGVNLFSMIMTFMAFSGPITSLLSMAQVFAAFEGSKEMKKEVLLPKLAFIGLNLLAMSLAVYKCWSIGLLPTTVSDWAAVIPVRKALELSVPAAS